MLMPITSINKAMSSRQMECEEISEGLLTMGNDDRLSLSQRQWLEKMTWKF